VADPASRVASAPGRVTVLGEHTDYNEGSALGIATRQRTEVTVSSTWGGNVEVTSEGFGTASCELDATVGKSFVVLAALLARTAGLRGARIDVRSDLPIGAGLASSASYAVAVALGVGHAGDNVDLARRCQEAERVAGSDVGLLDQLVVLGAHTGAVVDLDFTGPVLSTFPLSPGIGLSVVDSGVRRRLATTEYGARRSECEQAARVVGPLGRASEGDLAQLVDARLRRRARHVVTECRRVGDGRIALREGNLGDLGALLDEGHASLRDDFEVSTPALESVRDALRCQPGVTGVRLTGAGFGGCLIVAHDPQAVLEAHGRWSSALPGSPGASLSSSS
jgi:galactokinase